MGYTAVVKVTQWATQQWSRLQTSYIIPEDILSFESHKGIITIQIGLCSIKNQKGAISITTDFVQRQCPSGSQRNIFE